MDGRRKKEIPHNTVGLVVGITPEMFELHYPRWNSTGFRRRFLPIFFDYSPLTITKILKAIDQGKVRMILGTPKKLVIPPKKMQPAWTDDARRTLDVFNFQFCDNLAMAPNIRRMPDQQITVVPKMGAVPLPFTPKQMLQELAEAHAIKDRSGKVRSKDMEFVGRVVSFTRYGFPVQL